MISHPRPDKVYAPHEHGRFGSHLPKLPCSEKETVSVFDFQVAFMIPKGFVPVALTEYGFEIFEDGPFQGWTNEAKDILFCFGRGRITNTDTALSMTEYHKFVERGGDISDVTIHPISSSDGRKGASTTFWGIDTDGTTVIHTKLVLSHGEHWVSLEATHINAHSPYVRSEFISNMTEHFQSITFL